jgi:hypothetical protein
MSTKTPNCRTCREPMEEGWIADHGHANVLREPKWIEGEPQLQRWLGINWGPSAKGKKQLVVTAWRCPRCGMLESYAQ